MSKIAGEINHHMMRNAKTRAINAPALDLIADILEQHTAGILAGVKEHMDKRKSEARSAGFDAADMATAAAQGFRDGVASLTAQAAESVTEPAGVEEGDIDAVALARYKVVPAHESMIHRFAVVAGDGKQHLYLGREVECENMARKFAGAFLDGAFYQANITPPTQAADSVPVAWLRNTTDPQPHAVTNLKYRSAVDTDAGIEYIPVYTTPQPIPARADGFFLLLPQRPKPEAPAGTAGLDWDAYSGAQMLAFGRDCSDAAIAALRTQQPAPAGATLPDGWVPLTITHEGQYPEEVAYGPQIMMDRLGKWLGKYFAQAAQADSVQEDALRERDEADDFIDTLLDEVLGADRAEWSSAYGRAEALEDVRERITALHKPTVDRAWKQFEAATKQPGDVVAYLDVGAGGYLDLGSELSEDALQQLPKGRHALVIAGTYGIDGYVAAPQPSYTAQAADPVAWYEYNGDLDAWFITYSNNPKAKTRQLVFGDTAPKPVAREPLSHEQQIAESLRKFGLTLVKTASGYDVLELGKVVAHGIKGGQHGTE